MNVTTYIIDIGKTDDNIITNDIISSDIIHTDDIIGGEDNIENINEINSGDNVLITNTNESECNNNTGVCSSEKIVNLMSKFIQSSGNKEEVVKKIEQKLKCDSESCVLIHPEFDKFIKDEIGDNNIIKYELNKNFKTKGPRSNTNLLSNFNIDETLLRWGREFNDFYPCPFSMIDFKIISNTFGIINLADIVNGKIFYFDLLNDKHYGPFKTFACVLNTDVSTGRGKHWVCIFVDCRSNIWTIEYFNSSGNPPHYDVNEWMEKQRSNLLKIHNKVETITVTNIVHQKSNTECGMYVLYYIRSRLDGISYNHFLTKRIDDSDVTKFRKHVFRKC